MRLLIVLLLVFYNSQALTFENITFPEDVVMGNNYSKSLIGDDYKEYGMQVVNKNDGHPVRAGELSIRFEVQPGDCGDDGEWSDCKNDRERHELRGNNMDNKSTWWYAWSLYLPKDHINVYPTKVALGQFHQTKGQPVFMFEEHRGGYYLDRSVFGNANEETIPILTKENVIGQWNDILVNVRWSEDNTGYFKLWANGNLIYDWQDKTKSKGTKTYFKFGIYRTGITRWLQSEKNKNKETGVPGQIAYYDEVRTANQCKDLKLGDLGYVCSDLESQEKASKQDKKDKMIEIFRAKVLSKIMKKADKSKKEKIELWLDQQMDQWMKNSNFDKEFNKVKSRKEKQNQIIEKGIKKFS